MTYSRRSQRPGRPNVVLIRHDRPRALRRLPGRCLARSSRWAGNCARGSPRPSAMRASPFPLASLPAARPEAPDERAEPQTPHLNRRADRAVPGRARPLHPGAPRACARRTARPDRHVRSGPIAQPHVVCSWPDRVNQPVQFAAHESFGRFGYFSRTRRVTIGQSVGTRPIANGGVTGIQPAVIPRRCGRQRSNRPTTSRQVGG
jgi:hypothetical protein